MQRRLSSRSRAATLYLMAAANAVLCSATLSAKEMHEFFTNTRQSPAAVDYGAAYYDRHDDASQTVPYAARNTSSHPAQPTPGQWAVDNGARRSYSNQAYGRQASLAMPGGSYSITSWLGRRPNGSAFLGVQLDRRHRAEAMIIRVDSDSPAAYSGLRTGDVIRAVNGQRINSPDDLPRQISRLQPGERVQLAIDRPQQDSAQNGF